MAGKPPYFPLYVKDFSADSKVEAMTAEEVGGYILILCKAWHEEIPGSIPDDDVVLSRWSRLGERWSKCRDAILAAFMKENDGRYHQKRLQFEHRKLSYVSKRKADGGRKCANIKKQKTCDSKNDDAKHSAEHDAKHQDSIVHSMRKKHAPGSGSYSESQNKDGVYGEGKGLANPDDNLAAYNPMLVHSAREVVDHYQKIVGGFHGTCGGENAVIAAILNDPEATPEVLKLCAERLAVKNEKQNVEPKHAPSVRSFYAKGGYREFVLGQVVCNVARRSDKCFSDTPQYLEMHPEDKATPDQVQEFVKKLRANPIEKAAL